MHIIIDGYNLIRQSDSLRRFERSSLEEGRNALIRFIMPYRHRTQHRITVVFDGWKTGSPMEERDRDGSIDIIYSRRGRLADDVIKELAEKSGEEIIVVTSDRNIASFVERHSGTAISSHDFEAIVNEKIGAASPGNAAREEREDGDDSDDSIPSGKRKKGPAKRLSRRERDYRKRIKKL
ncbi:MAG: NYN domain-containing protein [Syntrophales bacterium]|nr:NYN domain-containing protein [Syntrophales bacterium]